MIKTVLVSLALFLAQVSVDDTKVRYGDSRSFMKSQNGAVAVIKSQNVYLELPSYKKIVKEKVKTGTARYTQLMEIATKNYKKLVAGVAKSQNLVLVVETGGISGYPTSDITNTVIAEVRKVKTEKVKKNKT